MSGNHQWLPVDFVPAGPYMQSVFECVNCKTRRTNEQMGAMADDQQCRWANLDPDEPITLPDDPRLQ